MLYQWSTIVQSKPSVRCTSFASKPETVLLNSSVACYACIWTTTFLVAAVHKVKGHSVFSPGPFSIAAPMLSIALFLWHSNQNDWRGHELCPNHTQLLGLEFILERALSLQTYVAYFRYAMLCNHQILSSGTNIHINYISVPNFTTSYSYWANIARFRKENGLYRTSSKNSAWKQYCLSFTEFLEGNIQHSIRARILFPCIAYTRDDLGRIIRDYFQTTFAELLDYFQSFGKGCQIIRRAELLEEVQYYELCNPRFPWMHYHSTKN